MKARERAREIGEILDSYFPDPAIPLKHKDPYTLLIAVLLSAQSTDARVNTVTPALFALANKPETMAAQSYQEVEDIIRPVGLAPKKARAIVDLSAILHTQYAGIVPSDLESLEALPGVGHKTASVVQIQAFGIPAFPVDTHIHRLAYRWKLSTGKNVVKTEEDLKRVFPPESWAKVHLQMIYFGRKFCPARGHHPEQCPICSKFGRKSLFV